MTKETLLEAADFFVMVTNKMLADEEKNIHAETLILSIGRMAGSLMYRTFIADASIVLDEEQLVRQSNRMCIKLMEITLNVLQELGQPVTVQELDRAYASPHYSSLSFEASYGHLAPFYLNYCQAMDMSFYDASIAGAIALGVAVNDCAHILPIHKGAALGVYGLMEGVKANSYPIQTH